MALSITSCATLNNGVKMPWFGLGTWRTPAGSVARDSVVWALEAGYRHIDTAALYENEADVGQGIRDAGLKREDVFITTKVWNTDMREGKIAQAMAASLKKLKMEYVDLYLLHWPTGDLAKSWSMMEKLLESGRARAIGVSNFYEKHLETLLASASVVPSVNQVEWHPWLQLPKLRKMCRDKGIVFEAWAPLIQGKVTEIPEVAQIGKAHGKTPAQVALRWGLQHDVVMIPKSVRKERIVENAGVFDFELSKTEMATIDKLDRNERVGPDPMNFNF